MSTAPKHWRFKKDYTKLMNAHPKTISEFENVYREEYKTELESADRWIRWAHKHGDGYGVNFHQGLKSALIFNDIKMCQLLRVLKGESPNV